MHPTYFVFKLLSVGFQHFLIIAYSKTVYWHCLVAITPKENHGSNNAQRKSHQYCLPFTDLQRRCIL